MIGFWMVATSLTTLLLSGGWSSWGADEVDIQASADLKTLTVDSVSRAEKMWKQDVREKKTDADESFANELHRIEVQLELNASEMLEEDVYESQNIIDAAQSKVR